MSMAPRTLRVVAADDSGVIRHMLVMLFSSLAERPGTCQHKLELIATVADGVECLDVVRRQQPDLLLLDLEMPHMSGIEVLDVLHRERPEMAIIMCSAYTARGAAATMDALARGAADYVMKPTGMSDPQSAVAALAAQLLPKIEALAERGERATEMLRTNGRNRILCHGAPADIVGIGVSTGGPAALEQLLPSLPASFPVPVVIVQHMPKLFTSVLAQRLNNICPMPVQEAIHDKPLYAGTIWLAPGDSHLEVVRDAVGRVRLLLHQGPPEQHSRPSVDCLFRSLVRTYRDRVLGVVLTGMGSDGLSGAREIVRAGGRVLAQDRASSAIWGMPGRVTEEGLASAVLSLSGLSSEMIARVRKQVPALPAIRTARELSYVVQ